MINNQLARRNITDEQRKYLIGKRMANEKKQGERTDLTFRQSDEKSNEVVRQNDGKPKTSGAIATEYGVSSRTVERNQDYAKAVDAIAENVGEDVKSKILSSEIKLTDKDTKELSKEEPEIQSKVINLVETKQAKNLEEAKKILSPAEETYNNKLKEIDREHDNHRLVANLINEIKFLKINDQAVEDYFKLVAVESFKTDFIKNCDRLISKLNEMKMYHSNLTKIRRIK